MTAAAIAARAQVTALSTVHRQAAGPRSAPLVCKSEMTRLCLVFGGQRFDDF
jgi:hypothetical protein